jgi:patatin-like phospholipase/acyl hydrolase
MQRYRILSLDGGGIRGLITAIWLDKLETELGKPLNQHFDLISGTSTGSILATAIGLGIPAKKIIKLYKQHGAAIFPRAIPRRLNRITRVFAEGFSAPKYSPNGLETCLQDVFEGATLGDLAKPSLIFSYNVFKCDPLVFKSHKEEYKDIPAWQAVRASCSAPTYFPAMVMQLGQSELPLIDGGVAANNPSACAVAEGIRINAEKPDQERVDLRDFILASFGTGSSRQKVSIQDAKEWGAMEWALPIIDLLFEGSTDTSDYVARQILHEDNYYRFQTSLDESQSAMDNPSPDNLNALSSFAESYITSEGAIPLQKLISKIKN